MSFSHCWEAATPSPNIYLDETASARPLVKPTAVKAGAVPRPSLQELQQLARPLAADAVVPKSIPASPRPPPFKRCPEPSTAERVKRLLVAPSPVPSKAPPVPKQSVARELSREFDDVSVTKEPQFPESSLVFPKGSAPPQTVCNMSSPLSAPSTPVAAPKASEEEPGIAMDDVQ